MHDEEEEDVDAVSDDDVDDVKPKESGVLPWIEK